MSQMRLPNSAASIALACIAITPNFLHAQQSCEDLKKLTLDHVTITSAVSVDAGPMKQPATGPVQPAGHMLPRHCEVAGVARPTSDSEIDFLLWLPPADAWNGKYMQVGNGGWAGTILMRLVVRPLTLGYAVSATDDGHRTEVTTPDASFAIGHPEKLIDFGYRALHETTLASKAILDAYYGKPDAKAYFFGCSDGGREALMEAQRYPEDFDGIVAGAPANHWTHQFAGFLSNALAMDANPESMIPDAKLPAIQKAALAQCDALDGVKDGLIENPLACHFDPSVLLCHGADTVDCLTQPQLDAVEKIYAGTKDPVTGEQIYPGSEPGSEAEPGGWGSWILGNGQGSRANSFFGQAVHEDPKWDWHNADLHREVRLADEKTAAILNSWNPDLRSFRDRGGKLIQYHGWNDYAIAPRDSIAYYERVRAFLATYPDPRSSNPTSIDSFYRLFMVPGMHHCLAGTGATNFGNTTMPAGVPDDADHDVVMALDRWVTQGIAPDRIIATGTIGADPKAGVKGTPLTRPICVFPAVAHYKGKGDTNAAENFECVIPPAQ
jgi:feruloyl esterase